jgi:hypothetical protein
MLQDRKGDDRTSTIDNDEPHHRDIDRVNAAAAAIASYYLLFVVILRHSAMSFGECFFYIMARSKF